jgi:GNAT superfamily N-acetyltransferase
MKTIELTAENIDQYLTDCVEAQKHLVSVPEAIDPEKFKETARDDHAYFLGVVIDDRLLGMGLVSKVVHPADITGYVNNIVVHPDARGQGLFKVIMDALETKAKEWGCTDLALTCSRDGVQEMYQKRGYKQKETHFYLLKIT